MSRSYPWEEYREAIKRVYIEENNSLQELKEYLRTVDPTFKPYDRTIKNHLERWGFTKNRRSSSCKSPPGPESQLPSPLPVSRSAIPFSEENPTAPIVKARRIIHIIPPSDITHSEVGGVEDHQEYIRQAGAAILSTLGLGAVFLRNLKISQEGIQNSPSVCSANLVREPQCLSSLLDQYREQFPPNASFWQRYLSSGNASELRLYLDTMHSYAEQLETTQADLWHLAALNTVAEFLTSVRSLREASSIVRILRITMRSLQLPHPRKEEACDQFLQKFLEFEDGVDMLFGFEPYKLVVLLRGAEESGFANTPATIVHYLRLTLKLAMEKPVINRDISMMFTATLCKMVDSLIKQMRDDGGEESEPLGDNHSNGAGSKELQLGANDLPPEVQMAPIGLAFQLQFFAWLHQMVNWDCFSAENLLVTIVDHLISIATAIATQNRSEKNTQTREYLSTFALGMNTALPAILDPKHCCWSMSLCATCNSLDLFNMCRGRCMRYLKILKDFECFCTDGLENADFSERGDIISKLSKDITGYKGWVTELSSNMKCPSQWWVFDSETSGGWD